MSDNLHLKPTDSGQVTWATTIAAKQLANGLSYEGWRVVPLPDDMLDGEDFVFALRAAAVPLDPPTSTG